MPKTRNKNRKNRLSRLFSDKRFHISIFALLFGAVGVYLVFGARAVEFEGPDPIANRPFAITCGYDVSIYIDSSGSVNTIEHTLYRNVAKAFANNMGGTNTQIRVLNSTGSGGGQVLGFTGDMSAVIAAINTLSTGAGGDGYIFAEYAPSGNPRPGKQALNFIVTDGGPDIWTSDGNDIKSTGARVLAFTEIISDDPTEVTDPPMNADHPYTRAFGPNIDTGSIFTSDIITSKSNYNAMFAQLGDYARRQICDIPGGRLGPGPGDGPGPGGSGPGTAGSGPGTSGIGPGAGASGGGGGSSATTQSDADNATPSNTDQGDATEQPKVEPSPFFDGKLFAIGSDSDANIQKDKTVGIGGLRFGYGWFYLLGLLILLGVGGWFGWKWWQKRRMKS